MQGNGCKVPNCRHLINNGIGCNHPDRESTACPLTEADVEAATFAERRQARRYGRRAYDAPLFAESREEK